MTSCGVTRTGVSWRVTLGDITLVLAITHNYNPRSSNYGTIERENGRRLMTNGYLLVSFLYKLTFRMTSQDDVIILLPGRVPAERLLLTSRLLHLIYLVQRGGVWRAAAPPVLSSLYQKIAHRSIDSVPTSYHNKMIQANVMKLN